MFPIDIDETFPIKSLEFTKSPYFGSNLKKLQETSKKINFSPQNWIFIDTKIYFKIKKGVMLIDLNEIFPMKTSEFKFPIQSTVMLKKTAKN